LENSTKTERKTKSPSTPKVSHDYSEVMTHIVDLSERVNFIMEGLKTQAEMLQAHQELLARIKPRMGL